MESAKKHMTTAKGAKDYLSKHEIPQLFECLMTGLMYNRPDDYLDYLIDCIEKIKKQGISVVRWDMFLEAKKAPLPPIESLPKDDFRPEPLPEIGSHQLKIPFDAMIIVLQAGPGMNKAQISESVLHSYSDFIEINVGKLLRERSIHEEQIVGSKWNKVKDMINSGQLAPREFTIETLIGELNKHENGTKFLITGYPRNLEEKEDFVRYITVDRLKFIVLVDSDEEFCVKKLTERGSHSGWNDNSANIIKFKLDTYKTNTLAVCKFFDDMKKLRLIDGETDIKSLTAKILKVFEKEVDEDREDTTLKEEKTQVSETVKSRPESAVRKNITEIPELTGVPSEMERESLLSQSKVVLLLGGPASGKTEVARKLCEKHENIQHFDFNRILVDRVIKSESPEGNLAESINDNEHVLENWIWNIESLKNILQSELRENKSIILIEGYPKTKEDLANLNIKIGSVDHVVLLDSEEEEMRSRLEERFASLQNEEDSSENIDIRLSHFKNNGLSICRYYDERSRLNIISSDRDVASIADEVEKVILGNSDFGEDENNAAVKIQASFRGHLSRKQQNKPQFTDEQINAAVKIQSSYRGHLSRKQLNNTQFTEEQNNAAVKIQSSFRGHLSRKQLNTKSKTEEGEEIIVAETSQVEEKVADDVDDENAVYESYAEEEPTEEKDKEKQDDLNEVENDENKEENNVEETNEEVNAEVENKENNEEEDNEKESNDVEETIEPENVLPLGLKGVRTESQLKVVDAKVILLLGGPGSGKKTLTNHLVGKYGVPVIHVDQLISEELAKEPDNVEEFKTFLEQDDADFTCVLNLIRRSLVSTMETGSSIIVTGFPKTSDQFKCFVDDITDVSAIFHLDIDSDTLKSRLTNEEDTTDSAGQAPDERIQHFSSQMENLLEDIGNSDKYYKIDAARAVEEIVEEVSVKIDELGIMNQEADVEQEEKGEEDEEGEEGEKEVEDNVEDKEAENHEEGENDNEEEAELEDEKENEDEDEKEKPETDADQHKSPEE